MRQKRRIEPDLEENEQMEPVDLLDLQLQKLDAKLDAILEHILKGE
jgi:hypothetical protein